MRIRTLTVLSLCGLAIACADESAEHLRAAVSGYTGSFLTLRSTLSLSFRGQTREGKGESPVVCVNAGGLLVTSNPELPAGVNIDFKSLQVVQTDGKEIEVKVVGRDADYGLLFLKPTAKDAPALPAAPVAREKALELGDEVFLLRRLTSVHPEPFCQSSRVISVIQKPRLMYMVADAAGSNCVVLDAEGKLVGLTTVVKEPDPDSGQMHPLLVVLPMARVLEAAKSIEENPEAEKKPEVEGEGKNEAPEGGEEKK